MALKIQKKEIRDLYKTPIVQQTSFWSKVKEYQGITSNAFEFKVKNSFIYDNVGGFSHTNSDIVVFYQYLNQKDYIAYLPYGPEIEPSEDKQGLFLEELSENLKPFLDENCITLRYDLNWESQWNKESNYDNLGNWMGEPKKDIQEFRFNYSTQKWNFKKSNSDILPKNTIIIDLNRTKEEILAGMHHKTRYNIRLSQRKNIVIKEHNEEGLQTWYKLYTETALRNGLHLNDISYFNSLFFSEKSKANKDVTTKLLIAYHDDEPLAAMFLILSNHRSTYLYGASSNEKRNFMPTYALQWRAIEIAKEHNCFEYDMFGVAPRPEPSHPMYGLYKFKKGFGGELFHQMGCWDYPLHEEKYQILQAHEINLHGYYV